jgi:FtsH-binding integral membrane protein
MSLVAVTTAAFPWVRTGRATYRSGGSGSSLSRHFTLFGISAASKRSEQLAVGLLLIVGFGAAGYGTRGDLSKLGRAMSWALLGLILFGVVAIFVQVPGGSLLYDVLGWSFPRD